MSTLKFKEIDLEVFLNSELLKAKLFIDQDLIEIHLPDIDETLSIERYQIEDLLNLVPLRDETLS